MAAALQLRYIQASSGLVTSVLDSSGGLDLGFRAGGVTSIAFLPHGRGGYLLFGGRVDDPSVIANDIGRLLLSNILISNGRFAIANIRAAGTTPATAVLHVNVPRSTRRVMLVATGSDTYPFFLTATTVNIQS
jgi:hypothetical protein